MTVSNRAFFPDSITEGWRKKDWVLNLLPLGGIASVTYEIGSTYLSSKDRTAKISADFFKSPIQTTLKKIAQCFWVPIVVCGALKLVSLIVNACWNRCFAPINNRPKGEDFFAIIPPEIVVCHIFSYLSLHELGVISSVSKSWNEIASTPILWQSAVYREIAFSSKNWAQLMCVDLVKDVDLRQEMLSLPKNIREELRCSAFPGKNIKETHVLVRMPKGLTIKKLGEIAKKYFPKSNDRRNIRPPIVDALGDKPTEESVWLLMTKDVLSGSRGKNYSQQKTIVAKFAKTAQVPTTLEATTCIFAEYYRSAKLLFNDTPVTFIRCQEKVQGYQVTVGKFSEFGLVVDTYDHDSFKVGVAALQKF